MYKIGGKETVHSIYVHVHCFFFSIHLLIKIDGDSNIERESRESRVAVNLFQVGRREREDRRGGNGHNIILCVYVYT